MLFFRASLTMDGKQKMKDSLYPETRDPARAEIEGRVSGTDVAKSDNLEEGINWPQLRNENAMLQIPSFKRRTRWLVTADLHFRGNGCLKNWPERKRARPNMWRNLAK